MSTYLLFKVSIETNPKFASSQEKKMEEQAKDIWKAPVEVEQERSRDEDFSEYLEDLFM